MTQSVLLSLKRLKLALVYALSVLIAPVGIQHKLAARDPTVQRDANEQLLLLDTQISAALKNKEHEKALSLLQDDLILRESTYGLNHRTISGNLYVTAGILREVGEYAKAIPLLERCLKIQETAINSGKTLVGDYPTVPDILIQLWLSCKSVNLNVATLQYAEQYLSIVEKQPHRDLNTTALLLAGVAELYRLESKHANAISALESALKIEESLYGKESKQVANCHHKIALNYESIGDFTRAKTHFELGLQIRHTSASEDQDFALSLRDLARFFWSKLGESDKALDLYKQAEELTKKLPHCDVRVRVGILGSFANFHRDHGNFSSAQTLYEQSIKLLESSYGPDSVLLAPLLGDLGRLKVDLSMYDEAGQLYAHSLKIIERAEGTKSRLYALCLDDLSTLESKRGNFAEALKYIEKSIVVLKRLGGENHADVAAGFSNLAMREIDIGKYSDAGEHLQLCLDIQRDLFGPQSISVAKTLNNYSQLFSILGAHKKALNLAKESLEIAVTFEKSEMLQNIILSNMAQIYSDLGEFTDAEASISKVSSITEKMYGRDSTDFARVLNNMANLYQSMGKLEDAEEMYRESLRTNQKLLGADHPSVIATTNNLATLLCSSHKIDDAISSFLLAADRNRASAIRQMPLLQSVDSLVFIGKNFYQAEMFHSACAESVIAGSSLGRQAGAEQLALNKALLEEVQTAISIQGKTDGTVSHQLRRQYTIIQNQLSMIRKGNLNFAQHALKLRDLELELNEIEVKLTAEYGLRTEILRERHLSLSDIAGSMPLDAVLVDFVQYGRYSFAPSQTVRNELNYAAYLTFPRNAGNGSIRVERVDLGEAGPINEAVSEILCVDRVYSGSLFGISELIPKISNQIGWQIG